ncbi:hypothetical protein F5Y16DRAFT_398672 [Xylariaceae sp. FL0255]|nr:hypothetical protein F5Y16DRAFT_398672 [Xylariaceae sp. FL0255]
MSQGNPYRLLGVNSNDDILIINQAYHNLTQRYRADNINQDTDTSHPPLEKIHEAYEAILRGKKGAIQKESGVENNDHLQEEDLDWVDDDADSSTSQDEQKASGTSSADAEKNTYAHDLKTVLRDAGKFAYKVARRRLLRPKGNYYG